MIDYLIRLVPGNGKGEPGGGVQGLKLPAELRGLLQSLDMAQKALDAAASSYPVLRAPARAVRRLTRAASRPFRIAILGESNSGKSSIANLLTGGVTLPALPVANTRLPTLLYYAPTAVVRALHAGGKRFPLPAHTGGPGREIIRLEVGLPSPILRDIEILDFPGAANPLFPSKPEAALRHGVDAAIWATVATQAWRETERIAWVNLPLRIKSRSVLAVTHCDLIATEADFRKLKARLQAVAVPHFSVMCFIAAASGAAPAAAAEPGSGVDLFSAAGRLSREFAAERRGKALLRARRLAAQTLARLEGGAKGS